MSGEQEPVQTPHAAYWWDRLAPVVFIAALVFGGLSGYYSQVPWSWPFTALITGAVGMVIHAFILGAFKND